jgi:hypothetical protein
VSSIPHDGMRSEGDGSGGPGRGFDFLRRHSVAIGLIFGLLALGMVAAFALSATLLCRFTGYDCAATPGARVNPVAAKPSKNAVGDACAANPGGTDAQQRGGACRLARAAITVPEAGADAPPTEDQGALRAGFKWKAARECAAAATPCGARTCYEDFLSDVGDKGQHGVEARRELARVAETCKSTLASSALDGRYLGRSQAVCGAKPQSVVVEVKDGEISWRYEFRGIVYQWRGEVDAAGAIVASVGGSAAFSARGRLSGSEHEATMALPDCPAGVAMRLVNKIMD